MRRWESFWFKAEEAHHLALARILFFSLSAFYFTFHTGQMWLWADTPNWQPVGFLRFFESHPMSVASLRAVHWIWVGTLVLSALGLWTRLSTAGAFLLGNLLVETRLSAGEVSHDDLGMIAFLLIFALSRCGDALSLDSWRKPTLASWRYRWPVRAMWVVLTSIYFGAAISKLSLRGVDWVTSDTLQNILLYAHYLPAIDQRAQEWGLGLWLSRHTELCHVLAGGTLLIEICAPLALFCRFLRTPIVMALFLLHFGFYFTASSGFVNGLFLFACWSRWPGPGSQEEDQDYDPGVGQEGPAED